MEKEREREGKRVGRERRREREKERIKLWIELEFSYICAFLREPSCILAVRSWAR